MVGATTREVTRAARQTADDLVEHRSEHSLQITLNQIY